MHLIQQTVAKLIETDVDGFFLFRSGAPFTRSDAADGCGGAYSYEVLLSETGGVERLVHFYSRAHRSKSRESVLRLLAGRFACGSACAVASDKEEIVGAAWICPVDRQDFAPFARCLGKQPGGWLCFDAFVVPEHRGRRLQIGMDLARRHFAATRGALNLFTFVGCQNLASIKNSFKVNDAYKMVYCFSVELGGRFRKVFYPTWKSEPWKLCRTPEVICRQP